MTFRTLEKGVGPFQCRSRLKERLIFKKKDKCERSDRKSQGEKKERLILT